MLSGVLRSRTAVEVNIAIGKHDQQLAEVFEAYGNSFRRHRAQSAESASDHPRTTPSLRYQ